MNPSCSTSCSRAARASRPNRRLLTAVVLSMLSVAAWAMPVLATQTVTTRHKATKPVDSQAPARAAKAEPGAVAASRHASTAHKSATPARVHYANGAACELTKPRGASTAHGRSASAAKPRRRTIGVASYYGRECENRPTASGERFDPRAMTAAHRTLPFGTRVRVTNLENGRQVVVRINDRGPYRKGRLLDLSHAAARKLGFVDDGVAHVRIEVLKDRKGRRERLMDDMQADAAPVTRTRSKARA